MQALASALALLGLAACGEGAGPRIALPLAATDVADPMVGDFIEVCSRAIVNLGEGVAEARRRGWKPADGAMQFAPLGFTMLQRDADDSQQIQIYDTRYPHLHTKSCQMLLLRRDEPVDAESISKVAGVEGGVTKIKQPSGEGSRGLWSFIGPKGDVVTITSVSTPPVFMQMTMATSERVAANKTNAKN